LHYDELLRLAKLNSDHKEKVIELEPAIIESLANTDPKYPALEVGSRYGGSSCLILAHIEKEAKHRPFVTVDVDPEHERIREWTGKLGVPWTHYRTSQEEFVSKNSTVFGFVYLDADHEEARVKRDIGLLIPYIAPGGIIAVDDVENWSSLPSYEGLERVDYSEAWKALGYEEHWQGWHSGHHFIAYRKSL
jgi:predicted O-methyltransferase YrrM